MSFFLVLILIAVGIWLFHSLFNDKPVNTSNAPRTVSIDLGFDHVDQPEIAKGKYLFLDIETTGLPVNRNAKPEELENWPHIVQIAWLLFDENKKLIESNNYIIKQNAPIPQRTIEIHRITDEIANKKGQEPKDVLVKFSKSVANTEFLIAHNISFDLPIVESEFLRNGFEKQFSKKKQFCTMEIGKDFCAISKRYGKEYKLPTLTELYKQCFYKNELAIELEQGHNADIDVRVAAKCFFYMLEQNVVSEKNDRASAKKIENKEIDFSIYRDNFSGNRTDYSYLEPSEARKEMRELKKDGWLDDDDYFGLMDAIASGKDEQYLLKIEMLTPEKTFDWFRMKLMNDAKMSSTIWREVAKKVAPMHELYLLQELDSVTTGRVGGWVKQKKLQHYFFTQVVYDKALSIRKGEIENRKSKKKVTNI